MRTTFTALSTATLFLATPVAHAVDTTLTQAGYTGLGITPNAHLLGWGRMEAVYDNELPGLVGNSRGHNIVLGFGLLPNLEVSGRIASNELSSNCFTGCGGVRDLSAAIKGGIGLDAANRFRVAAGVSDFGGAATLFRTYYGVLTYNEGPYEISGGIAHRSASNPSRSKSPLDGPFAAAAWQPLPWVRGHVEYADSNAWAGVRLFAPKEWLPEGWSAHIGANFRLTETDLTSRSWLSAGISIPLYKVPTLQSSGTPRAPLPQLEGTQRPLPAFEARTLPQPAAPVQATPVPYRGPGDEELQQLAEALRAKGLEDISVGRMTDNSIAVRVNNATYNWNSADAVGAALGGIANVLGAAKTPYRFVLMQRQIPIVAVTGQADCLRQWIQGEATACAAGELSTPGTSSLDALHAGVAWVVQGMQPSNRTLRVAISPVLRTNVATELGVLDYSLGVNVGFRLPVWAGADVEWRVDQEIASSDDYKQGNAFSPRRIRSGTERLAFTQTVRLPFERWVAPGDDLLAKRWGLNAVTAQATIGRVGRSYDGAIGSLRWEPGEGAHRASAQLGYFRNHEYDTLSGDPKYAKPMLVDYRYNVTATRTYLEAIGGQFMRNDRGLQIGMRQWFGDLSIGAYYRRTKFDGAAAQDYVGMELTVPIGPRRDMNPRGIQVTGTPRFGHGIYTAVGSSKNAVGSGVAMLPPVPNLESVFNSDRAGLLYFEDNIRRIRDAAR